VACRNVGTHLATASPTLGSDLSGEILAIGTGVSELRVGDQVYGVTNPRFVGAYAEYALASAEMVSHKPSSLTHVEAASVPAITRNLASKAVRLLGLQ
jgi:NADPH:quinone reductase-like Zn-dependent oxidoreductase